MQASWAACPCCLGPVQHRMGIYLNKGAKAGCSSQNRAPTSQWGLGLFPGFHEESGCWKLSRFGNTGLSPDLLQCQSGIVRGPFRVLQLCGEASSRASSLFVSQKVQESGVGALEGAPEPLAYCANCLRIWDEGCWGQ